MCSNKIHVLWVFLFALSLLGCSARKGKGLNFFSTKKDIKLGLQISEQIESDTEQFPILSEEENPEIYDYVRNIVFKILNTGKVKHRDEFSWEVKLIDDKETLNAFATPGGHIYIYTGLIQFLDSEDQLAGVIGHEIAHAAHRHSTRQMSRKYGMRSVFSILAENTLSDGGYSGDNDLEKIAIGFITAKFSRSHEKESDRFAVDYLCATDYKATGVASFFKKMQSIKTKTPFLSSHPSPSNRIEAIEARAKKLGCTCGETYRREYVRIKSLLN